MDLLFSGLEERDPFVYIESVSVAWILQGNIVKNLRRRRAL